MFCKICGGAIDPDVESINGTHAGMDYCVVILNARVNHEQARAEAAERRVAELEAQRDDYHMKWVDVGFELGQFADDLIAVLKLQLTDNDDEATTLATIVTRVTELEAQLAAQEWRPVTEPPGKADWRSGFLVDTKKGIVYYADEYDKGAWLWGDGYMKEIEAVTHWIFLPTSQNKTQG